MTPVIRHLYSQLNLPLFVEPHQSLNWTFAESIKKLGPDFYSRLMVMHPTLNLEYSVLCNQIRHNIFFPEHTAQEQIIEQLTAALMLAQLLEELHLNYLVVPREVDRLRRQQALYRSLLTELGGYLFSTETKKVESVEVGLSLSQLIRDYTALTNWFRLLLTRAKRVFNLLEIVGTGSQAYSQFVAMLDYYTNPFFTYIAWCFFIPRFITNLFLLFKHTVPGFWMDEKEASLEWWVRFEAQIKRRWFELGNDAMWVLVGLINCFLLVGPLAPFSIYFTVAAFAFDIGNTGIRAYIELNRLFKLQKFYADLYAKEESEENRKAIKEYQNHITHRIQFEQLRMALSVANAAVIFIAMSLALPFLFTNPILPFIGAVLIIAAWVATYTLTQALEQYRPNDAVEIPLDAAGKSINVSKLGFFAKKEKELSLIPLEENSTFELDTVNQHPKGAILSAAKGVS